MIGWIGNLLLAVCGIPEAYLSYKRGHSRGISFSFLMLWFTGELFTLVYILNDIQSVPLVLNYAVNITAISTILRYKIRERK